MTVLFHSLFDSVILDRTDLAFRPVSAATEAPRPRPVPRMSASLWRHTLDESADHHRHGLVARGVFWLIAALGVISVAYALWQTCDLMAGDHLRGAVQAFVR